MIHSYSSNSYKNTIKKRDKVRFEQKLSEKLIISYASSFETVSKSLLPEFRIYLN